MLKVFHTDCRLPSSHCLLKMCGFPAVPLLTATAPGCVTLGSNCSKFVKGMKYKFLLQHSGLSDTVCFIFIVLETAGFYLLSRSPKNNILLFIDVLLL